MPMRIRFVHVRRPLSAMADIRLDLATHLSITSLLMVRNIKCGYSFSYLGQEEDVESKFERIMRNFLLCNKTASCTVCALKMTLLGI